MPARPLYRQRFAQDLRAYKPDQGGLVTGGTFATLIDTNWPIMRNLDASSEFDGWHVLRPAAVNPSDRVRLVNPGLYDPRTGTFTVDRPYQAAPVFTPTPEPYELHGHGFEPWFAVDQLLNAALQDIHVVATIPFAPRTASGGTYSQNLTSGDGSGVVNTRIPALRHPAWVHEIDQLPAAQVQVQTLTVANAAGGFLNVSYQGIPMVHQAWNATGAVLQAALRAVPYLEAVEVTPQGATTAYTVKMFGAPPHSPLLITSASELTGATPTFTAVMTTPMGVPVVQSGTVDLNGTDVIFYADRFYEPGDYLYLKCQLPAYYWCRTSATAAWGSQVGLSAETHEAQPTVEWVSAQAQVYAWKRFPDLMQDGVDHRQIQEQAKAQADADRYQAEFLRNVVVSPILHFPVGGGSTSTPSPVAALAQDVAPATSRR